MSGTKDQINPTQDSGVVNPKSTITTPPGQPTSPNPKDKPQTTTTTQSSSSNNPNNIAFHSAAIGTQTARPKDYFAEQNQKDLTKKQANSAKIKWSLIISGGIAGVALVVGIAIIVLKSKTPTATPEEIQETVTATYDDAFDEAFTNNSSDPTVIGPTEESINTATEIYNQAIEDAGNDSALTTELRLSQIDLYIMTGERYEEIIRLGSQINPDDLPVETRTKFYNNMAEAYWMTGNRDEANRYYELIFELDEGGPYGG